MMISRLVSGVGVALQPKIWSRNLCLSRRVMLVSDTGVFRLFGRTFTQALQRAGWTVVRYELPVGEAAKTWQEAGRLVRALAEDEVGRDGAVIALGGGAVTDVAGFAAGTYLRGIAWASIPTTLLGQLDSGLGGKTGVNLPEGKNLAGVFHQPSVIVCDAAFLKTLPERERLSGLAEALKYGLIFDRGLWRLMTRRWDELMAGNESLTAEVVRRGAQWKLKIVARDERESHGPRELLNFGHTLGHALESSAGYGALRHGEAVIWGMRAALRLSRRHAGLSQKEFHEAEDFLKRLPVPLPECNPRALLAWTRRDKKARQGRPRFVLLKVLGKPVRGVAVADKDILSVIRELL